MRQGSGIDVVELPAASSRETISQTDSRHQLDNVIANMYKKLEILVKLTLVK